MNVGGSQNITIFLSLVDRSTDNCEEHVRVPTRDQFSSRSNGSMHRILLFPANICSWLWSTLNQWTGIGDSFFSAVWRRHGGNDVLLFCIYLLFILIIQVRQKQQVRKQRLCCSVNRLIDVDFFSRQLRFVSRFAYAEKIGSYVHIDY